MGAGDGWYGADVGAANGHGNARSVARIMSALALGGATNGVRLLRPKTIDLVFQEQAHGPDLFLGLFRGLLLDHRPLLVYRAGEVVRIS